MHPFSVHRAPFFSASKPWFSKSARDSDFFFVCYHMFCFPKYVLEAISSNYCSKNKLCAHREKNCIRRNCNVSCYLKEAKSTLVWVSIVARRRRRNFVIPTVLLAGGLLQSTYDSSKSLPNRWKIQIPNCWFRAVFPMHRSLKRVHILENVPKGARCTLFQY